MKAIVCEMCSSHDIVKDGDFYVCQSCGTKYTPDAARKLMVEVEGKVDVSGSTVKVDNADSLANLRQVARRARESGNIENAEKYYEMVAIQDPNDWEAAFYSVYYQAAGTNIAGIESAANRVANTLEPVAKLIRADAKMTDAEKKASFRTVATSTQALCQSLSKSARMHYNEFDTVDGEAYKNANRQFAAYEMLSRAAGCASVYFDDNQLAAELYKECYKSGAIKESSLIPKIKLVDPSWGAELESQQEEKKQKKVKTGKILKYIGFGFFALVPIVLVISLINKTPPLAALGPAIWGLVFFLIGNHMTKKYGV